MKIGLNSLNDATKQVFLDGVDQMCKTATQRELDNTEAVVAMLEEEGMVANEITPENYDKFVEAIQPMYDKYYDQYDQSLWDIIDKYK